MWTTALALFKATSLRQWLVGGALLVVLCGYLYWSHHEREIGRKQSAAKIATITAQLTDAHNAIASNQDVIASLQFANAQCETGRLADQTAQMHALSARDQTDISLRAQAAAARSKLDALLAGRCKDWASQPACGGVP